MSIEQQREYWATLKKVERYKTIEFYDPDFGSVYLVANKFFPVTLKVDGLDREFTPVNAEIPEDTENNSGQTRCQIKFSRIGIHFRQKLRQRKNLFEPIRANIRYYIKGIDEPTKEFKLFVNQNGVSMDESSVTVELGYDNPARLSVQQFYDPAIFTGLQQ